MSKNIVVCLDGTWNNALSTTGAATNVHALYLAIARQNQLKVYRHGVGSNLGWLGARLYGAAGKGVFQTARDAWSFVAENHQPGDRIFIFGFSRGAYAARHLAGMIVRHGLKGWRGGIEETFREWLVDTAKPSTRVCQPVHFLGLFDCVPGNQLYLLRDRSVHLNVNRLEPGILNFRHAVSIHERRLSFKPIIFEDTGQHDSFAQHWFPGFHSDVGGGDGVSHGLSCFSLWWMLREAYGLGLDFENIQCPQHRLGHMLTIICNLDPEEAPTPSDYITTRLGLRLDRAKLEHAHLPGPTPAFASLDVCPRCGHDMFDYFKTDVGQRWLLSKGFAKQQYSWPPRPLDPDDDRVA